MEIIIIKQFLFMECRKTAIPIYCLWDISWVNFELVRTSGTIRGYSISGTLRDHFSTANWTIVKVREIGNGTIEAMINHWVKSFERYLSFYSYQFSYFDCNPWSLFLGGISSYDSSYDQFERFCIHNVCMKIEHTKTIIRYIHLSDSWLVPWSYSCWAFQNESIVPLQLLGPFIFSILRNSKLFPWNPRNPRFSRFLNGQSLRIFRISGEYFWISQYRENERA